MLEGRLAAGRTSRRRGPAGCALRPRPPRSGGDAAGDRGGLGCRPPRLGPAERGAPACQAGTVSPLAVRPRFPAATRSPAPRRARSRSTQWSAITAAALDDLEALEPARWCIAGHDALLLADARSGAGADLPVPRRSIREGISPCRRRRRDAALLASKPPRSLSTPELARLMPADTADRGRACRGAGPIPPPPRSPHRTRRASDDPERDSHRCAASTTNGFRRAARRGRLQACVVSTYHAGSLICLRPEGGRVNTHFRGLPSADGDGGRPRTAHRRHPFGGDRLLRPSGCRAARLEPEGTHDACFLPPTDPPDRRHPRSTTVAHAGGETWVVATRFSCLATLDGRAQLPAALETRASSASSSPEDRCHLNGLCVDRRRGRAT